MNQELEQYKAQYSSELEMTVLGALLTDPSAMEIVLPMLRAEDLYEYRHQIIYNAILNCFTENIIVELINVVERLKSEIYSGPLKNQFKTQLDFVGGAYYVTQLTNYIANTATLPYHCLILKQYSAKRELGRMLGKLYHLCQQSTTDVFDLIGKLATVIDDITARLQQEKATTISGAVDETIEKIVAAGMKEGDVKGTPSGLASVDRQTMGFNEPDFIVVSATTGEGKTTWALQCAVHAAKMGYPAAFASMEMKSYQLVLKMLSMETGIDIQTLRRGKLSDESWDKINGAAEFLKKLSFHFSEKGGISIIELKSLIYSWVKTAGVKIVFIDYLQLITVFGVDKRFDTREQEVNYISKQLKAICMDLNIPIIALSQMSRKEKGAKRKPVMSDLRESGAIEQDADGIMFIWRPVYNGVLNDPIGRPYAENDAYLLIVKYRLGQTGAIPLTFKGGESKFTERTSYAPQIKPVAQTVSGAGLSMQQGVPNDSFDNGFDATDVF